MQAAAGQSYECSKDVARKGIDAVEDVADRSTEFLPQGFRLSNSSYRREGHLTIGFSRRWVICSNEYNDFASWNCLVSEHLISTIRTKSLKHDISYLSLAYSQLSTSPIWHPPGTCWAWSHLTFTRSCFQCLDSCVLVSVLSGPIKICKTCTIVLCEQVDMLEGCLLRRHPNSELWENQFELGNGRNNRTEHLMRSGVEVNIEQHVDVLKSWRNLNPKGGGFQFLGKCCLTWVRYILARFAGLHVDHKFPRHTY